MPKALVIDDASRDVERLMKMLAVEALDVVTCASGSEVEKILENGASDIAIIFLSAEIPGPPFGMELILRCRRAYPNPPIVVLSSTLEASLATRAATLGASDFLEKPLDDVRLRSCIRDLMRESDPLITVVEEIQSLQFGNHGDRLIGESPTFLQALRQAAKVVPHRDSRVLILGESGTGKELIARAIHNVGIGSDKPWVAVNIAETPATLVEATLFGHEKGAFTDAHEARPGLLEDSRDGTLFLDEIGDLELPLQGKLLRVIQERQFRRLGSNTPRPFQARLICATNVELAGAMQEGTFRRDLYHRIAEVVIQIPSLRERPGDIERLIEHFLRSFKGGRSIRFAKETVAILRSYPFPGNIRELQNLIHSSLIQADGDVILPRHLPLANMEKFLLRGNSHSAIARESPSRESEVLEGFVAALKGTIPKDWMRLKYREAVQAVERAFDKVYLQRHLEKAHHNVTKAAASADMDTKTFRKHWKDCGLPPLSAEEEQS